jgi:hypothetical protein
VVGMDELTAGTVSGVKLVYPLCWGALWVRVARAVVRGDERDGMSGHVSLTMCAENLKQENRRTLCTRMGIL